MPLGTSLEATVCCPHCNHSFALGELMLTQFASWQVVDDPASRLAADDEGLVSQSATTQHAQTQQAATPSLLPNLSLRDYERRKRKQTSGIWSLLPIVLGGLAAFPIALLILWHGLGRDVANLGPEVARFAPWIVPKKFHPNTRTLPTPVSSPPARGASGFRQFDELELKSPAVAEATAIEANASGATPAGATIVESSDAPAGSAKPAATNPFERIRQTRLAVEASCRAIDAEAANRLELFQRAYDQLAEVAVLLDQQPSDSPTWRALREELEPLCSLLAQQPRFLAVLNKYTQKRNWLDSSNHPRLGLVTTLEIHDALETGLPANLEIKSSIPGDPQVQLILPPNWRPQASQQVIAFGVLQSVTGNEHSSKTAASGAVVTPENTNRSTDTREGDNSESSKRRAHFKVSHLWSMDRP